jgi:hypothetical protein
MSHSNQTYVFHASWPSIAQVISSLALAPLIYILLRNDVHRHLRHRLIPPASIVRFGSVVADVSITTSADEPRRGECLQDISDGDTVGWHGLVDDGDRLVVLRDLIIRNSQPDDAALCIERFLEIDGPWTAPVDADVDFLMA